MFTFKNKLTGETKEMPVKPKARNAMFWSKWDLVDGEDKKEDKVKDETGKKFKGGKNKKVDNKDVKTK